MSNLLTTTLTDFTHVRVDNPPIILRKYPHLISTDANIWTRFLTKYPKFFTSVSYDIHVGKGTDPGEFHEPNIRQMAITLTQRRIDVLAERNGNLWIVELKKDPGISIIGQLIGYEILLKKQLKILTRIKLCMISNRADNDLITCLRSKNIKFYII